MGMTENVNRMGHGTVVMRNPMGHGSQRVKFDAMENVRLEMPNDSLHAEKLQQLVRYVRCQLIDRRSVGAQRLCLRDIAPPQQTMYRKVIMPAYLDAFR